MADLTNAKRRKCDYAKLAAYTLSQRRNTRCNNAKRTNVSNIKLLPICATRNNTFPPPSPPSPRNIILFRFISFTCRTRLLCISLLVAFKKRLHLDTLYIAFISNEFRFNNQLTITNQRLVLASFDNCSPIIAILMYRGMHDSSSRSTSLFNVD